MKIWVCRVFFGMCSLGMVGLSCIAMSMLKDPIFQDGLWDKLASWMLVIFVAIVFLVCLAFFIASLVIHV